MRNFQDITKDNIVLAQPVSEAQGNIYGLVSTENDGTKIILAHNPTFNLFNNNIMAFGGCGSGKTTCFAYNAILQAIKRNESIIVTDRTYDSYHKMAEYAKEKGYVVRMLDLQNFADSDGWDVLNTCIGDQAPVMDAGLLAETIINNVNGWEEPDDIYVTGAASLLSALMLRVKLGEDFQNEDKDLESVYKLLVHPDGTSFFREVMQDETLKKVNAIAAKNALNGLGSGSPNLLGNLLVNLSTHLRIFQTPELLKLLSRNDIDLELPGKQPCLYFCRLPLALSHNGFLAALFINMILYKLIDLADKNENHTLQVPVNFILDDFADLGYMPGWERKLAVCRSRGICISMTMHDLPLLETIYGKNGAASILNNCFTWMFYGTHEFKTAKLMTSTFGQTNFYEMSMEPDRMSPKKEKKLTFFNMGELLRNDRNAVVVCFQQHDPIVLDKFYYQDHPDYPNLTN